MTRSPSHSRPTLLSRVRDRVAALFSSQRAADTASIRVWLIRIVALTLLLGGNALIQAAAMQPAIIDGTAEARRYSAALDGAVAYALLVAVLMVVAWRSRHDYWRVLVGAVLVVGGALGALYSITLVPEPGPTGGMGLRGYLGTYAFACCALAGLVSLLAYSGRLLFRPWRVVASGVIAAAGIVGLVSVAELWFPPIVAASNIAATTTNQQPPAPGELEVDGSIAWGTAALPGEDSDWYETSGGLLGTTSHGLKMLDPTTGEIRWSYDRYDVVRIGTPRMSANGDRVAVTSVRSTTASILRRASDAQHVWLFDAASGRLLGERLAPSISSSLRAYADGLLIWAMDPDAAGRERGWLGATDPTSGRLVWQLELPRFCGTDSVRPLAEADSALLVAAKCWDTNAEKRERRPGLLLRVNADAGTVAWHWSAPGPGTIHLAADGAIDGIVPLQVADVAEPTVTLAGLDAATGEARWLDTEVDRGLTSTARAATVLGSDVAWYDHVLRSADGNLVVGSADGTERVLRLAGLDPETGRLRWERDVPIDWPSALTWRVAGLSDGRLVVVARHEPDGTAAGVEEAVNGSAATDVRVALTSIDAADGSVRSRATTELGWRRVQLFRTETGLVLRSPGKDDTVLVGLR